ncbi:hypothetical protein Bbelb_037290 [Branchiostoma belcheri]|nr:hypothetical protein Bbelb_037290 [Branchiostoma belcheri]
MSSKKLFPNDKAAPEGSEGRQGNRWTNGIVLALSGLAAVVSVVSLLVMLREIASMREQQTAFMREARDQQTASILETRDQQTAFMRDARDQQMAFMRETRDQQTAFMREARDQQRAFMKETRDQQTAFQTDLQGLRDQVLLMHFKQEKREAKDKGIALQGPASSTEDWQRDDSATFGKCGDLGCLSGPPESDGSPQVPTPAAPTAVSSQACPDGWRRNQRSCYLLVDTPKTWRDARDACHLLQADLASLTTADEQTYMRTQTAGAKYWFGLSDIVAEGDWQWADGTDYDPAVT